MNAVIPRSFYAGLGVYAAFLALAAAPSFPAPLHLQSLLQLGMAAAIASMLAAIMLLTGIAERIKDGGAAFTQALFGIGICVGLYYYLSDKVWPNVVDMALLWIIVGISHLNPRRVLTLMGVYLGLYGLATFNALWDSGSPQHADTLYVLLVSCILGVYLYWRSHEYEVLHEEKRQQAAQLEAAVEHIEEFTVQDTDTTALKQAYFMGHVAHEKARVDSQGGTFCAGFIDIDGYAELHYKLGETVAKQVLREFANRADKIICQMDTRGIWGQDFKPLGRIAGGRFGVLLPAMGYEGAAQCAEHLHTSIEFQSIRTTAGVLGITLSIGIVEYPGKQSVDDLMKQAAKALDLARSHNGNDYKVLKHAA
ncbi:MAG TPA: GGDEF domain-containing protein [Gammaproteobacteria bacterium]|nr:GGDEF domain-containing protein [Gammaproteobacteria bacterium]